MFRNIKIKYRLILGFLLISIVPMILSGYFFYSAYSKSFLDKMRYSTNETLSVLIRSTERELEKYEYLLGAISVNDDIQKALIQTAKTASPSVNTYSMDLSSALQDIHAVMYPPYVKNIRIVNKNNAILYDLGYDNLSDSQLSAILEDCARKSPLDSWTYTQTFRKVDMIISARRIYNASNLDDFLGYVLVFVDEGLFSQHLFENIDLGEGSSLTLLDEQGTVLSTTGDGFELGNPYPDSWLIEEINAQKSGKDAFSFDHSSENGRSMINCILLPKMGCYLMYNIPFSYIYSEMGMIRNTIVVVVFALIAVCLAFILFLYRSIVSPVKNIEGFCDEFSSGDLSKRIDDTSEDEMGVLSRNVNSMAERIEQLLANQKEEQKRKRKLELKMLQYQINPHFLFNSLNTLKWIAMINKVTVVSNGITALADLLKSTLVNKDEYIALCEEIQNLKNYFEIQKLRYANFFMVCYELDDSLQQCMVPKFILQPLAENSILHGIDTTPMTITIRSFQQDNALIIELIDNGKGFDTALSETVASKKMTGIGVSNVNERLKLSFGSQYGLQLESEMGKGTICRISIPLHFRKE